MKNANAMIVGLGLTLFLAAFVGFASADDAPAAERPNILWLTCEDLTPLIGCYGDRFATTPNIDRLAREGLRYTNAFAMASVCSPARSCLITGVYPVTLGTQSLRSDVPIPANVRCFPEYLREAGYYCTNNVKEDYQFKTPPTVWDESSNTAHWRKGPKGKPFFSVFNCMSTHQSRVRMRGEELAAQTKTLPKNQFHDVATVPVPPYYPDTPEVRRDMANLYDLVTVMDLWTGNLLKQLEEDGLADDTIVFFYSDHGTGMPRHKRWLYDSGLQVPLIVKFPKKYAHLAPAAAGGALDRFVSFVDFAPTVLSLAGLAIPESMQGTPFLGAHTGPPRERIYAVRDRVDEVIEVTRAVRTDRYKYIRNYMPHRPVMQIGDFSERGPTRHELRRLGAAGELKGTAAILLNPTKPIEELYDIEKDPLELNNLAGDAAYQDILADLRTRLQNWILAKHDTGFLPEGEIYSRCLDGQTPCEMASQRELYPLHRVLATAELVGRKGTGPQLAAALESDDSAVRYWGAVGLLAMGADAEAHKVALRKALSDPSPFVRITAAEALGHLGELEVSLPVLGKALVSDDPWARLYAAVSTKYLGAAAASLASQAREAMERKGHVADTYTPWALEYFLSLCR
jgi:uncharacterized sulfatase